MANTTIQIKKSSTPAATPSSLANGELAINYADGKLFYKAANGTIVQFSTSESNSFGTVNANSTLLVSDTTGDVLTIVPGNNITIVGDAVNDKITVGLQDSPTFYGDTTVRGGGKFIAGAVGGDEGGEILLEKPPNGTLDGGVTIDAYQNKLRIFEQGGSARGVYIDLSAAGAGVSTNLLTGGGGSTDTTARAEAEAAFAKANSANYYAYLVDANTTAAFGRANSSNTVAIANVNYVNTAMQAAFAAENITRTVAVAAFDKANTSGGGASVAISDAAPSAPTANSLWWSSDLGKMFIYYNDGTSYQWVETSPSPDVSGITTALTIAGLAYTAANNASNTANLALANITTSLSVTGAIRDGKGDVRDIPITSVVVGYALGLTDTGETISTNTTIYVPNATFGAGNTISVYNNSSASITITQNSGVTMYLGGTATTGNRTLAQRGLATVYCVAANTFVIGGLGLT